MQSDPEFDVAEVLREFDEATLVERVSEKESVERIENFTLLECIGEGGFGSVWRAKQERPVRREVAVKVLKSGMDTREVLARFGRERQVLALMDHPEIAKVFDAGMTESGRPFFAMELMADGVPITSFCREANPGLDERLGLFSRVCSAVQHAHRKGVIHRDLKPTNILVFTNEGGPQVKVIDFGIAKATRGEATADFTVLTRMDRLMGTPAYMSPESLAEGSTSDTRSDVYSLGVVLYEMLTGMTPFSVAKSDLGEDADWERIVRDSTPRRPSTVVMKNSGVAPGSFRLELKGDLDRILLKAVDPEPDRRYGSPEELADDIDRFIKREPVEARERSTFYVARRFAQRHRAAVIGGVGILLALLAGLAVSATMFVREKEARRLADLEVERSRQTTRILKETLGSAGYSKSLGRDATMLREILDAAAERLDSEAELHPEIESEIRGILGETYLDIDDYRESEAQLRRRVEILRELEPGSGTLAETLFYLAHAVHDGLNPARAEPIIRESIAMMEEVGMEGTALWHSTRSYLAWILLKSGRALEGEDMARQAYEAWLKDPENRDFYRPALPYQTILQNTKRPEEAEAVYRESIAVLREIREPVDIELITTLGNFGKFLGARQKHDEAVDVLNEALEKTRKVFGDRSPNEDHMLASLAGIAAATGEPERELELLRDAVAASVRAFEPGHRFRREPINHLIKSLFRQAGEAWEAGDKETASARLSELERLGESQREVKVDSEKLKELRERIGGR